MVLSGHSATTETGRDDIAEILLKVALKHKKKSCYIFDGQQMVRFLRIFFFFFFLKIRLLAAHFFHVTLIIDHACNSGVKSITHYLKTSLKIPMQ